MHHLPVVSHLVADTGFFSDKIAFGPEKIEKMTETAGSEQGFCPYAGQAGFKGSMRQPAFFLKCQMQRNLPVFQPKRSSSILMDPPSG